jgi:HAMP domain-containing protein
MVNLRARLAKVKVGDSGHVHVLALAGPERGQWLLHPEHSGRPAAAQRDAHDQPAYAALLAGAAGAQAVSLADGEHLLRYAPYPDWQWLLVSDELADEANAENRHILLWLLGGVGVLLVCLVAAMALTTHRLVSRPLGEAAGALRRISQARDLTARLPTNGRDEISALAQAFNGLQDALQHALCATHDGAQQVDAAARGVSDSARQVALDSHRQSQAAQSMAGEIDQLTQAIADIAHDTRQAHALSAQAAQRASHSQQAVASAIEQVGEVASTLSGAASTLGAARQQAEQINTTCRAFDKYSRQYDDPHTTETTEFFLPGVVICYLLRNRCNFLISKHRPEWHIVIKSLIHFIVQFVVGIVAGDNTDLQHVCELTPDGIYLFVNQTSDFTDIKRLAWVVQKKMEQLHASF